MRSATIPGVLREAAVNFGGLEAVVDGNERLTFRQLAEQSEAIARALIASGVEPGDRVAIWAPNSARWAVTAFAVYSTGAVLVPLNTRFRGEEAGHVLRTSGATILLTVTDFLGHDYAAMLQGVSGLDALQEIIILAGPERPGSTSWNELASRAADADPQIVHDRIAAIDGADPSDIIFTSGTTGAPKGAVLGHEASVRTYLAWSELVDLREGDRFAVVFPLFHTAGLKSGLLACVLRGATAYPIAVFDVPRLLDLVEAERITMLPGPPTVFQSILDHPDRSRRDLSSLRSSVTGAAVVPVTVIRKMRDELGIATVVTGYGMTETTGTISMCRFDDPPEVIAETVGRPIPGVEVRVVDDGGNDVEPETPGELLVRGYNVMSGYFNNPEATADAFSDGWLRTGDIGLVGADGNLRITDRKKDMFIVGGFNAYPAEIEAVLLGHEAVAQVAVVGIPDRRMGELGVAFVVGPAGGPSPDPTQILAWAWERLARFKLARVEVVDELPLNPSGKVMKFLLRDRLTAALHLDAEGAR